MADDVRDTVRKKYEQKYSDPLNPDRKEQVKISEQRRRLWDALNDFIREHGGAVVSVPGHKTMRIEIGRASDIPAKLIAAGHQPYQCGSTTRIDGGRFATVDVIEIVLP